MRYRTAQLCKSAQGEFTGVWDDNIKKSVEKAFLATEKSYAQGTWERVEKILNKYLDDWTLMRGDVCEAKHVHGTELTELFDLRISCLKDRKQELRALSKVFATADTEVVNKAVQASLSLTAIDICADEKALRAPYPPPKTEDAKKSVAAIREKLAEVEALNRTGKYREGLELVRKVEEEANTVDYRPVQAEMLYWLGCLLEETSEYEKAEATLHDAARAAGDSKAVLLAAKAMTMLVFVVGYQQARHDAGLSLGRAAEVMLGAAGGDAMVQAMLLTSIGSVFWREAEYAKALEFYRKSLAIREKALGPEHHLLVWPLSAVGNVLVDLRRHHDALEPLERAVSICDDNTCEPEPHGEALFGLARVLVATDGETERAIRLATQARGVFIKEPYLKKELAAVNAWLQEHSRAEGP